MRCEICVVSSVTQTRGSSLARGAWASRPDSLRIERRSVRPARSRPAPARTHTRTSRRVAPRLVVRPLCRG